MKKNYKLQINCLILLALIIAPSIILAETLDTETQSPRPDRQNMRTETRDEIKEKRQENRDERQKLRTERREDVKVVRRQIASSTSQRPPAELKVLREQNKNEINKIREDFSSKIKSNKASTTEFIKEKRQDLIKGIQEKRELFKEDLIVKKQLRASTTDAMKLKFKENLSKIKDENKKIRVENVSENLTELNTKIITRSVERINKIEEILISIESRTDKVSAEGVDVSNLNSLISSAESAIAEARTAITNQTGKTYTVSIVSESTVKASVQSTRDLLKKDIEIMNIKIKNAHEAVRKVANALKLIPKVNDNFSTSTVTN